MLPPPVTVPLRKPFRVWESGAQDGEHGPILNVINGSDDGSFESLTVEEQGDLLRDLYAIEFPRIRQYASPPERPLAPPYTDAEVQAFERHHDLALPGLFRQYILKVSREVHTNSYRVLLNLSIGRDGVSKLGTNPIPAEGTFFTHDDLSEEDDILDGTLYFGEGGCGDQDYLIVRGPQKGRVLECSDMESFCTDTLWYHLFGMFTW